MKTALQLKVMLLTFISFLCLTNVQSQSIKFVPYPPSGLGGYGESIVYDNDLYFVWNNYFPEKLQLANYNGNKIILIDNPTPEKIPAF